MWVYLQYIRKCTCKESVVNYFNFFPKTFFLKFKLQNYVRLICKRGLSVGVNGIPKVGICMESVLNS